MNSHWTAFGSLFFLLHQDRLLWLLNAPIIGRWFRRILRIGGDSSSVGSLKIDRILPHAIFWWQGGKQVAEFRTHAKFSKRLYYAFAPLWWTLHAWDWFVADRWVPQLSFGFATLTTYPDADPETYTVDGEVGRDLVNETWGTIRSGAGTHVNDSRVTGVSGFYFGCSSTSNQYMTIYRGIFLFDTSALTSLATISAAVLSLYGTDVSDGSSFAGDIDVYTSTPSSNTSLATSDYSQIGSVSQTGSPISYASYSIVAYNPFTFNATGIGNINKTGISKFGTRNANYDVANVAPTWSSAKGCGLWCNHADQTGTTNDPKLVVTYVITGSYIDLIRIT